MDYARKPSRKFFNLLPGKNVGNTVIMNSKPGNYLKSRWYNNGMFDMTNPNIYKTLVPGAVGIGASTVSEKKLGGYRKSLDNLVEKYQKGGNMESKWEYSVTNNTLLPQSQLKNSELGYLKDWLSSPMAKKIAVKREVVS